MDRVEQSIARKYRALGQLLDERGRRLRAAVEASELGRRGISLIARATGLSRNTISRGLDELAGNERWDPHSPLRWTCKSTRQSAELLHTTLLPFASSRTH